MKIGLSELLLNISKKTTKKEKIVLLQKARNEPHVFSILKYIFKDSIEWDLPEGDPPYTPLPKESDAQNVLYSKFRMLPVFMKGEYPNMKKSKREHLFIELIESLDPDDAKLIIGMKDKKMPFKGLTKKTVCDAFPEDTVGW